MAKYEENIKQNYKAKYNYVTNRHEHALSGKKKVSIRKKIDNATRTNAEIVCTIIAVSIPT